MQQIPKELQQLVYWSIKILGETIKDTYGTELYKVIEKTRHKMKTIRATEYDETIKVLHQVQKQFKKYDHEKLAGIAHAYSLMLELINRCESAYRSVRIKQKRPESFDQHPHAIIFVFTAHPTEARSPEVLFLFQKIYHSLVDALENGKEGAEENLRYLLSLALRVPMSRVAKPTVKDEAEYLYSYVLRDEIIEQQIDFQQKGITVNFRSWVGGDKDGHPGVDQKTMLMSLNISRQKLTNWIQKKLDQALDDLKILCIDQQGLLKKFGQVNSALKDVKSIQTGDGKKVKEFKKKLTSYLELLEQKTGVSSPYLQDIRDLMWLYPALVLPLEIREDSELVHAALKKPSLAIVKMLETLKRISKGFDPKWYVRGFVLSMVQSSADVDAGFKLTKKYLGSYAIPVVPLFENAHALNHATQILSQYFNQNPTVKKTHQEKWSSRFEVMLGYSDSSKESGVLPSRYLISQGLVTMDKFLSKEKLTPVFFHGSGGSIERGGGSIKEQTEWWPKSAVHIFKATTQGEMIARNFASDYILRSKSGRTNCWATKLCETPCS
jgi:phosphoenolpyruvate carboxylase